MQFDRLQKWLAISFLVLLLNTAYIGAFASPTVFYMGNVLLHLALGFVFSIALVIAIARNSDLRRGVTLALPLLALAFAAATYLVVAGNLREYQWALVAHIIAGGTAVLAAFPYIWKQPRLRKPFAIVLTALVMLPLSTFLAQRFQPSMTGRIRNPRSAPTSMDQEGGGPNSPFFPSSANTNTGKIIPANFFMDSEACGECHKDIYEQWKSSMHHFASFNNQFYRKSIEHMQSVIGTKPSKWCAGCHDHAVFFNGRFDRPIKEQIDTPEARAGLACTSCHAITHVASSMGNGDFTIEYPPLHEIATSKNPYIRAFDHFLTYLDPEPHRRTFMKPFMRQDVPEFCSACHKVHLDVPVNSYRWFRGFDDYDNWQASGVSGLGARSFYYPPNTSTCVDCHMPLVASHDPGNHGGQIHSHRFPAANTAVAYVNRDLVQLKAEEDFLKSGFITVDIFAASPVNDSARDTAMIRRSPEGPKLMSSFPVGEEAEQSGDVVIREVGDVAAPLDKAGAVFTPGSTARIDVVVRTRKIGHFFPAGTVDAFDVWLELEACDASGRAIFWSGKVEDDGTGPVEPGAHFYKSYQLDADGNPINKRNAWQSRSVLYARLIPPGAADVAHYRVRIPKETVGPVTLTAKLNYRKFSHYYTHFAYTGDANPSGEIKDRIPDLPIVTVAQAQAKLQLGGTKRESHWQPLVAKQDRERWNDWGIGLLLQGDLKGAEYAFKKVTEAEPGYADGWLNVARALIQEGETDAAKPYIKKSLELDSHLGRTWFFQAMIEKADGDYDAALRSLKVAASIYPRDRVVLNQIARILFLERQYAEAIGILERVCGVDPEDLQMHYTMMLCYRGLGDAAKAAQEEKLFLRFKAEESSQAITAVRRRISPEDNNERQQIHDHESAALP